MESFQNFRKLYGRIEKDLDIDNYKFIIENSKIYFLKINLDYNALSFRGKKFLILATISDLGISNFFGYALIIGSFYCLIILISLIIIYKATSKNVYDINSLKWN